MNEAIKLAIEKGGYLKGPYWWPIPKPNGIELRGDDQDKDFRTIEQIILDPVFWQDLGKVLDLDNTARVVSRGNTRYLTIGWVDFARHYFDLVLTGGDTEKFWKELTNANAPAKNRTT